MKKKITYKDLNRKQKISHIWEYYKGYIIGSIAVILVAGSIGSAMLRPRPVQHAADLIVTGKMIYDEEQLEITAQKMEEAINGGVEVMANDWEANDMITSTNEQTLSLRFKAKECDVLAIAGGRHQRFLNIEDFDPFYMLDTIPELEKLLEENEEHLIKGISKADGKEHVFGIRTDVFKNLEGIELGETYSVSILSSQKDLDAAVALVKYILE
ncbi:MAG: hypothetical protein ACRCSG_08765 [Cellulosilyticaceae bacterium]